MQDFHYRQYGEGAWDLEPTHSIPALGVRTGTRYFKETSQYILRSEQDRQSSYLPGT